MKDLALQCSLSATEITALARQYVEQEPKEKNIEKENRALDAGQRIREGEYGTDNLMMIVEWKSPRPKPLVRANPNEDVEDALRTMVDCEDDRTCVASLTKLRGVQVPMASAILTAFNPNRFTVIDVRALETLGARQPSPTIDHYLVYLEFCRGTAKKLGVSLRDFDRALWQQSKNRGGKISN